MNKTILSVALFTLIGSAHAAVNCNTFPNNVVTGAVNDSIEAIGYTCTIAATARVNGDLLQTGLGGLVIRGAVNGSVSETGDGSVTMIAARVSGSVDELDAGNITLRGRGSINGGMEEAGIGSVIVTVDVPAVVNGDIIESGEGSVSVNALTGSYEGGILENDGGNVTVSYFERTFL